MGDSATEGMRAAIVAESPVMRRLLAVLRRVAATETVVLIRGESGAGKEVFAGEVHALSGRRGGPFVRVNCAALPEALAESELFGHVRGAFTDSVAERQGRFEAARGGTLLFDEIADLDLGLQAKLLRVLQERRFEKLGSDVTLTLDARIVATSSRDLEALVEAGRFRRDLYYRLNVLPVVVPPLRERPEDVLALAAGFLARFGGGRYSGFSPGAARALLAWKWPGNVRELENRVERACVTGDGGEVEEAGLFPERAGAGADFPARSLKAVMTAFKAHYVRRVLEEHDWKVSEAARTLDVQRTYLSQMIKTLRIGRNGTEEGE